MTWHDTMTWHPEVRRNGQTIIMGIVFSGEGALASVFEAKKSQHDTLDLNQLRNWSSGGGPPFHPKAATRRASSLNYGRTTLNDWTIERLNDWTIERSHYMRLLTKEAKGSDGWCCVLLRWKKLRCPRASCVLAVCKIIVNREHEVGVTCDGLCNSDHSANRLFGLMSSWGVQRPTWAHVRCQRLS